MPPDGLDEAVAYWPDAFGLALSLVGDRGRAEELCQDAFARLCESPRELDRSRSLRPLVLTVVRHLAVNELRRVRPESLDDAVEHGHEPLDHAAPDPLEALAVDERKQALRAALAELSPRWRAMVYLRDGLELSYAEIADVVDTTTDVVRVTLHRARQRVRELLRVRLLEGELG